MPYKDKVKQKEAQKNHYLKNKEKWKERKKANIRSSRKWYFNYIQTLKCENCNEADWRCLEFDHIDPKTKYKTVSQLVRNHSLKKLKTEIAKCRVLCSNCHAKKTAKQFGWFKDLLGSIA